jgi:hypothetical protein
MFTGSVFWRRFAVLNSDTALGIPVTAALAKVCTGKGEAFHHRISATEPRELTAPHVRQLLNLCR